MQQVVESTFSRMWDWGFRCWEVVFRDVLEDYMAGMERRLLRGGGWVLVSTSAD